MQAKTTNEQKRYACFLKNENYLRFYATLNSDSLNGIRKRMVLST